MLDSSAERPPIKDSGIGKIRVETAGKVMAHPEHPKYTADKLVFVPSLLIGAADGVGSGNEKSVKAAELVVKSLRGLKIESSEPLTPNQAEELLRGSIFSVTPQIKELQRIGYNSQVDTTVSVGMFCRSIEGKPYFLTANVGDSRIYRFRPGSGEFRQLTVDHSVVQDLVDKGEITPDQAFLHPERNLITKSVGGLESSDEIDIRGFEILDGDIYLPVTDGFSDQFPPKELPGIVKEEYEKACDPNGKLDLHKFAEGLAQRARNIQMSQKECAKKDDIGVGVMQVWLTK